MHIDFTSSSESFIYNIIWLRLLTIFVIQILKRVPKFKNSHCKTCNELSSNKKCYTVETQTLWQKMEFSVRHISWKLSKHIYCSTKEIWPGASLNQ